MIQKVSDLARKYKEILLYLIFGFGTTVVNWVSYSVSVSVFHTGIFVGNAISWVLATVFAFVTNKYWVFESKSWEWNILFQEAVKFVSTRLLTGGFEILMVPALVYLGLNRAIFGVEGFVAKVLVSVVVVLLNYILSKLIIFKKEK